jgi:hypothetical protein
MTIIDDMVHPFNGNYKLNYRKYNLYKIFTNLGVYEAEKYSKLELYKEYIKCDVYKSTENINEIFNM